MTEVSVSVQIEAVTLREAWIAIGTAILNETRVAGNRAHRKI
jgi:hypothetical protein